MLSIIKKKSLYLFSEFIKHERIEKQLSKSILTQSRFKHNIKNTSSPYTCEDPTLEPNTGENTIFITGRFRSGSTLLWNIFRQLNGCTSYYEPFNERRWFNASIRGTHFDKTHIGVDDYWREYNGMEDLNSLYDEKWIDTNLYMDPNSWAPNMRAYIDELIYRAEGTAVLQFNRIDFRLPWIKKQYPKAKLIHLYRNPREQWLSFLTNKNLMNADNVEATYKDAFYLDVWCENLSRHFPFLSKEESPHPYQRFYYLWKLSFLFGQRYSDYSISFERLVTDPKTSLQNLCNAIDFKGDIERMLQVIQSPPLNKSKDYADDSWFSKFETDCEKKLNIFLGC